MTEVREPHTVAVVGAGAAGTLTAVQLCETATRRRTPLDLVLLDPSPEAGRGTAYATRDPRHRLNVPVGDMSCYPDDPGHFTRWLCRHGEPAVSAADFATRYRYGAYLADTLAQAIVRAQGTVSVRRLRTRAESCTDTPDGRVDLRLADGGHLTADSAVLATGPAAPSAGWAPPALRASDRFVAAPWSTGALDGPRSDTADVLLVGTGLTAVDLALTLDRPGRTVHALSRSGLLPQPHALTAAGPMSPPEDLDDASLGRLRRSVYRHISRSVRTHGDWRPALDSLRPHTTRLWHSLTPEDRAEFLAREGALWNTHRHRMAPATAESVSRARTARRLSVHTGTVTDAVDHDGSLVVTLSNGRTLHVGWVIDCTGPGRRFDDPLWRSLLASGAAVPGPARDGSGHPRRAAARTPRARRAPAVHAGRPAPRRTVGDDRDPRDPRPSGRPGTAVARPADAHTPPLPSSRRRTRPSSEHPRRGGRRLPQRPRPGAQGPGRRRRRLRALGRPRPRASPSATPPSPCSATSAAPTSTCRVLSPRPSGPPSNGPTSGSGPSWTWSRAGCTATGRRGRRRPSCDTSTRTRATRSRSPPPYRPSPSPGSPTSTATRPCGLVERTSAAHDGHWFHTSLLAFLRQEQGRLHEAGELAHRALAAEPASGHAVHALAHVHYESGAHQAGRDWLDGWVSGQGRGAVHRAHFSWHIALHELALDDPAAVRRRWFAQLAPGRVVTGVRALVDSGSLLWRARLSDSWRGELPAADVLDTVAHDVLERPATAFTALHAAVALAAAADLPALHRLRDHASGADEVQREVIVPLCEAFVALVEERFHEAARGLDALLPVLCRVGGSAAQREVVEETLLYALVSAGRCDAARRLLDTRLDRKEAPRDRRMAGGPAGLSAWWVVSVCGPSRGRDVLSTVCGLVVAGNPPDGAEVEADRYPRSPGSAMSEEPAVRELRLVVTAPDYDAALRFYRDVLGLPERAAFSSPDGRVTILEAGGPPWSSPTRTTPTSSTRSRWGTGSPAAFGAPSRSTTPPPPRHGWPPPAPRFSPGRPARRGTP